ncbi:hypothetical protein LZK98_15380 [Sphingomonas cannabina]|uniref:hypothetical protein n=1 Tax=Sphingomonas cannabina TaxID=2899123 RepID=UPI001F2FF395|nr:hypothetical protein [Sphingomonas cannabina]UIJ44435.1 hypothetical protein LZK98_15380 [Sphingomonas cannabina]
MSGPEIGIIESTPDCSAIGCQESIFSIGRTVNMIIGLVYLITFRQVYWSYISLEWGYTGLIYSDLNFYELSFIYLSVAIVSLFLPSKFNRPSSIIIWFMYAFLYVPTMAITMMIGAKGAGEYIPSLASFSIGFLLICHITNKSHVENPSDGFEPGYLLVSVIAILFALSTVVIWYVFNDIMTFAGIDDVYVQRFVAADRTVGVTGYLRTYYGSIFAPLLIAIGAARPSRWPLVILGILGMIMSYMVDASKISLVIPLAMLVTAAAFRWSGLKLYHFTAGMVMICLVSALLTSSTRFVRFLADLILLRSISIPAQTFAQYYDVFSVKGYTWWSNLSGLNLILPPPATFRLDQFWPVLGQIVGAEYYGFYSRVNLNANPFVGEGVAAASWFGVLVISIVLAFYLKFLDQLSAKWNRQLVLVLMVPVGLTLTNVHLSTFLVSFGGLAWLALFRFYGPRGEV